MPVIMTVITNSARADRAVITIYQFRLHPSIHARFILSFFFKEKEVTFLFFIEHITHYTSSFSVLIHYCTPAVFVCTVRPSIALAVLSVGPLFLFNY